MKRNEHRTWANAHHRRNGVKSTKRTAKGDPIILLLSSALVISAGLATYLWPSSAVSNKGVGGADSFACAVSSIADGDTLRCADGTRVRLHAVAARETDGSCSPGHPCPSASAGAATAKLSELAGGQTLQCRKTGLSYNRVTAICDNERGTEINCAMVQSGTALIWPSFNEQRSICQ